MRISLNLLKQFVKFKTDNINEIAKLFTDKVAEIDEVIDQSKWLEKVFVWQIQKIEKHPNADKMQVTHTKVWDEAYQIVCWAKNIYEWQKVPVALAWSILPCWLEIKKADKRWVESSWMLCTENELWLAKESEWILELPKDAPLWVKFSEYYGLTDVVFVVENTAITNRPDLFSHNSWAREAVACWVAEYLENSKWHKKNLCNWWLLPSQEWQHDNFPLTFDFQSDEIISRMQSIKLTWIKNWDSPKWIQEILKSLDIRPISLLVDAANLVMAISWVPIHIFDFSKINWNKVIFRLSKKWEKVTTLDWIERILPANVIIAEDWKEIFDLCWIMWWKNSCTDKNTSDAWIFVPVFNPVLIRRASISLNHKSDASSIFEKRVPDSVVPYSLECTLKIILEWSKDAKISSKLFDYYPWWEKRHEVKLHKSKLQSMLWSDVSDKEAKKILEDLDCCVKETPEFFEIISPSDRLKDIKIEEDLIEEIARIHWLQNIKAESPALKMKIADVPKWFYTEKQIKDSLSWSWFYEAVNFAFLWDALLKKCNLSIDDHICVANPISEDLIKMRKTLVSYLLLNLSKNKLNSEKFWIYEVARVFSPNWTYKTEKKHLAFACYNYDFFEAKSIVENLFDSISQNISFVPSKDIPVYAHWWQCADIVFQWKKIWVLSSLHPKVAKNFEFIKNVVIFEIDFDAVLNAEIKIKKYKEISKFPSSERDMNFVLDRKVLVFDFMKKLSSSDTLIVDIDLIDVYEWEQVWEWNKSVTFRIEYWSTEKTLTDDEVNKAHEKLISKAKAEWARFR